MGSGIVPPAGPRVAEDAQGSDTRPRDRRARQSDRRTNLNTRQWLRSLDEVEQSEEKWVAVREIIGQMKQDQRAYQQEQQAKRAALADSGWRVFLAHDYGSAAPSVTFC